MVLMKWICNPAIGTSFAICVSSPSLLSREMRGCFANSRARRRTCLPSPSRSSEGRLPVDYEEKVFGTQAEPGEKALVTFHTVAFEGSIGLVNMLQALRLQRKGFATAILLYGPGVRSRPARLPKLGDKPFRATRIQQSAVPSFMGEGGKVYAAALRASALRSRRAIAYSGNQAINPLDVLDLILLYRKDNAFMIHTWTV